MFRCDLGSAQHTLPFALTIFVLVSDAKATSTRLLRGRHVLIDVPNFELYPQMGDMSA